MQTGNRTLSIASINPDNFMNPEKQRQITNMLLTNKIHIAAIQETHLAHDASYIMNGYRIITSASEKHPEQPLTGMTKGGVAILIHTELAHYISNIQRIDHRIMTVTLHDKPEDIPITIMVTYAPHTGYSKKEKAEHWQNGKHTYPDTETTPNNLVCRCKWTTRPGGGTKRRIPKNYRTTYLSHANGTRKRNLHWKGMPTDQHDTNEHMETHTPDKT